MLITDKNYKEVLKGLCLTEVGGDSCANCISLLPVLNKIVNNRPKLTLHRCEVGFECQEIVERYEVEAVPTILLTYNDELIGKVRGFQPEEILEIWIDAKIEEFEAQNN